ncbi:MAG: DUF4159 domain-containing protein [Pseudomonadota bacterium]
MKRCIALIGVLLTLAVVLSAAAEGLQRIRPAAEDAGPPEAEFHMGRMIYTTGWGPGSRGPGRPWWAIDWPQAEFHFNQGLNRLTRVQAAPDSRHLQLTDPHLFDYPWLWAQQVGMWTLFEPEIKALREYLLRGGFLLVDDFHGMDEWATFESVMRRVFPSRPILDIPEHDPLLNISYVLDQQSQIPGHRHLRRGPGGTIVARLAGGPPRWRGIYDDAGRLMVAINFNMDMGDAWEHADDPVYPAPMTALAYRYGVNYVLYALTH